MSIFKARTLSVLLSNWVKPSGKLTVHDFQVLQALSRLSLEQFGQFRVVIEL